MNFRHLAFPSLRGLYPYVSSYPLKYIRVDTRDKTMYILHIKCSIVLDALNNDHIYSNLEFIAVKSGPRTGSKLV